MKKDAEICDCVHCGGAVLAMAVPGSAAYQPEQKFQDVSRSASYETM